jgi:hypothetical protein
VDRTYRDLTAEAGIVLRDGNLLSAISWDESTFLIQDDELIYLIETETGALLDTITGPWSEPLEDGWADVIMEATYLDDPYKDNNTLHIRTIEKKNEDLIYQNRNERVYRYDIPSKTLSLHEVISRHETPFSLISPESVFGDSWEKELNWTIWNVYSNNGHYYVFLEEEQFFLLDMRSGERFLLEGIKKEYNVITPRFYMLDNTMVIILSSYVIGLFDMETHTTKLFDPPLEHGGVRFGIGIIGFSGENFRVGAPPTEYVDLLDSYFNYETIYTFD